MTNETIQTTATTPGEGRSHAEVEFDSIGRAFDATKFRTENGRPKRDAQKRFVPLKLGTPAGWMPDGLRFTVTEQIGGEAEEPRAAFAEFGDARSWAKSRRVFLGSQATVRVYRGRTSSGEVLEEFATAERKNAPGSGTRAE